MNNYSELTGVQFDFVELSPFLTSEKAARASSHMLSWSLVEDGRYRFILFSMGNSSLGHNGTLMTLVFNSEEATILNGSTITMDNITVVHTSNGAKEVTPPSSWIVNYVPEETPTSIDQITNDKWQITNKIIKDNQILILRGDKFYTLQGQEVK